MVSIVVGILIVALVSTAGDYIWYEIGVSHRAVTGIVHGAVLLTAVGGVLGAAAGRLGRGLPLGALAGVAGALVYYALAGVAGGQMAMIAAWASLWIMIAVLDTTLLRAAGSGSMAQALGRGIAAAVVGGVAFALLVDVLWGRPPAGGRNYLVQFGAWALAWAPGILALTVGRTGARPSQGRASRASGLA